MQRLFDSYKNSGILHHVYFLVGETEEIYSELKNFLEKEVGVKTSGSADFWYGKYSTLNIDSARNIAEAQERKAFVGSLSTSSGSSASPTKKIFIIQADFITEEAQNSLLKVFEEPTAGTHFFIISPQEILLPTLRSRVQVLFIPRVALGKAKSILRLGLADRLAMVKEITDAIGNEEATKQDAISFLNQIESELYECGVEKTHLALEMCENARAFLYDRGAPVKMILENVALNVLF